MNAVRPIARLYVAALFSAAFAIAVIALLAAQPIGAALPLALLLWLCMTLAWLFPIHLARQTNLYVDTSVTVAAVLLLPPGPAMLAIGGGPLAAAAIRRQPLAEIEAPFNAAQAMLVAFVGSLILAVAGWNPGEPAGSQPWRLLALPAAAAAMQFLSVFLVAAGVALQAAAPIAATFRGALVDDFRGEALAQASLV
ncbi:MAG TPA: hypothetical protein VFU81_09290, partial [Thermomicrobiales bacterium]|nr:hypothetical protein [Thermomicrobiales bacterium]